MSHLKRLLLLVVFLLAAALIYLFFAPTRIDPVAWQPPVAPELTGPYEQNSRLSSTQRLSLGEGNAPEDVALDGMGRIYGGLDDGRIMQLQADGTQPRVFANTHGRPLGLAFTADGDLIVADAIKGLLSVNPNGEITTLATGAEGSQFSCLNDLDVAADGTIYFTEASNKFPMKEFTADILEHRPNGRMLAYDPKTKQARTILKGIHFANGVAISPDQSFVLVNETGRYRVMRVWLNGPKQGQAEVFIENLPGFPDGISSNGKDKFWLALVTPRNKLLDTLLPYPFLRKAISRLPKTLQPAPARYSFVIALDATGHVVENLQDPSKNCYAEIANVVEREGALYFGSIGESAIGRFALK
ncbi:MAG TPA: SMP-30/gluconolactonase/LRE family protein [Pyrinomonadaceae bacterium]|nr:SMP-30/gluconolactonase/LRE family protein [Pyrinomonadaceae bacterium]